MYADHLLLEESMASLTSLRQAILDARKPPMAVTFMQKSRDLAPDIDAIFQRLSALPNPVRPTPSATGIVPYTGSVSVVDEVFARHAGGAH